MIGGETNMEENKREIKSYVLRAGRMSKGQRAAWDNLKEKYSIEYSDKLIDFTEIFGSGNVCIEIGFGMGTATALIAEKNPEMNFIGIEVHRPGVGRLLADIEEKNLCNLKIINFDAVSVLKTMVPEGSVSGFHIFFPDPWPKQKHQKRRLINDNFTQLLVNKLADGGYIYTATDWENYAEQMLQVFNANKNLQNQFPDWAESPLWRPQTAFERKGLDKKHVIRELFFKKVSC